MQLVASATEASGLESTSPSLIHVGLKVRPPTLQSAVRVYFLRDPVFLSELNLDLLLARRNTDKSFKPLPAFPTVRRDVAMIVSEATTHEGVLSVVRQSKPPNLESVELFDVFRGKNIPPGQKSMAYAFTYRNAEQTLTDAEAAAARLQAVLDASHLVDVKKNNVLARVVSVKNVGNEAAYVVEFSLRSGARLRYLFSTATKLLLSIEDDARQATTRFEDYRPGGTLVEAHRIILNNAGTGELAFILQRASHNTGLADSVFDPPRGAEALDVVSLLREVSRNQDELEKRFTEYSFVQKETSREITSKGEVKKETTKVFEVFPIPNRAPVMKLISENGVPLSGERATKEQKRVEEEFLKAERDKDKDAQRVQKDRAERERKKAARAKEGEDDDVEISQFLKVHEFVSPRRERFRERDAVVFDFRVRPGFKSSNRQENLISKLIGVVWIDPADKQVMRLEARLAEGFKMGGGLLVNLRPGAAFVMEQTRVAEGLWLPRTAQINLSVKVLLFGGGDYNQTFEWSDYKHFSGDVGDYKLDAPKQTAGDPARKP